MLFKKFIKYHSFGNDFVLFDWHKKPTLYLQQSLDALNWKTFVSKVCHRHFGVGADGMLIVTHNQEYQVPEVLIFNADGSRAELCLNGLRCVVHYLFSRYRYPEHFIIKMGNQLIKCFVASDHLSGKPCLIATSIDQIASIHEKTLVTQIGVFAGYCVDIANPHFIIFDKKDNKWLEANGQHIESHKDFPSKKNVEFVWESEGSILEKKHFNMLVYERGCGVTLACGSGVSAVAALLLNLKKIEPDERVGISMPGGTITVWINSENSQIVLEGFAEPVFEGELL